MALREGALLINPCLSNDEKTISSVAIPWLIISSFDKFDPLMPWKVSKKLLIVFLQLGVSLAV